jgi:hypothetical protein
VNSSQIAAYAREHLEPIHDYRGNTAYRCAATLTDGLLLPCVLLASAEAQVALATRRLDETRPRLSLFGRRAKVTTGSTYADIVKVFAAAGNGVNTYDIASLESSPFAIPVARLKEIQGETSMAWTQFLAVMSDGSEFSFGTTYATEFFSMPDGYTGSAIARIVPHGKGPEPTYRERPFFVCFVDGL